MATAGAKVTIACKVGLAWIDLQLSKGEEVYENTQSGPRKITQFSKTGPVVRIRGTAYPRGEAPEGYPEKPEMVAGYALTRNVDKAWWDQWIKQHAKAPYVVSGMIMAYEKAEDLKAAATEHKGDLSGLEPVARNKDGITDQRLPRSTNKSVSDLEPSIRPA